MGDKPNESNKFEIEVENILFLNPIIHDPNFYDNSEELVHEPNITKS